DRRRNDACRDDDVEALGGEREHAESLGKAHVLDGHSVVPRAGLVDDGCPASIVVDRDQATASPARELERLLDGPALGPGSERAEQREVALAKEDVRDARPQVELRLDTAER